VLSLLFVPIIFLVANFVVAFLQFFLKYAFKSHRLSQDEIDKAHYIVLVSIIIQFILLNFYRFYALEQVYPKQGHLMPITILLVMLVLLQNLLNPGVAIGFDY